VTGSMAIATGWLPTGIVPTTVLVLPFITTVCRLAFATYTVSVAVSTTLPAGAVPTATVAATELLARLITETVLLVASER